MIGKGALPAKRRATSEISRRGRGLASGMVTPAELRGLDAALAQARKSLSEGGIPIGSALLDAQGVIVSAGHNLRVQTGDTTAHAETVCMRHAGRRRDWHTLTLISTLSPCAMCTGAAVLHRVRRVVIGENRTFMGREDWLRAEGIEVEVVGDLLCERLMREFIKARPALWDEDIGVPEERQAAPTT